MKNILLSFTFLFFAGIGFSQGVPFTVNNYINSGTVQVRLFASPIGSCSVYCNSITYCVFPMSSVTIPSCGPDFLEWSYAIVSPRTDGCMANCPFGGGQIVVSPTGCAPLTATNNHCHAGTTYTATFPFPNTLDLN